MQDTGRAPQVWLLVVTRDMDRTAVRRPVVYA